MAQSYPYILLPCASDWGAALMGLACFSASGGILYSAGVTVSAGCSACCANREYPKRSRTARPNTCFHTAASWLGKLLSAFYSESSRAGQFFFEALCSLRGLSLPGGATVTQ